MKKFFASIIAVALLAAESLVSAAENPTCVFMKFTDDTRFVRVESAESLSDLVMEKLLSSGQFNFKETKVIDADMENLLYEERAAEFKNVARAIENNNFDLLFEGIGYNENFAQTIATARLGQFVSPEITSKIGSQHGAEYLIQGTIRNIGTGAWINMDFQRAQMYAMHAMSYAGTALASLGPLGALAGALSQEVTTFQVQGDLKVIKASTGEVVWQQVVTGKKTKKQTNVGGLIKIGSDKIDNEMYAEAMDKTAQLIADALINDAANGKLFAE